MMAPATRIALASLALAAATCARPRASEDMDPKVETALRVENQAYLDMNVYVVRSGQRIRLGTVPGNTTRVFMLAPYLVGPGAQLGFLVDPVGSSRTALSEDIYVNPGDVIELVIPATVR